MGAKYRMNLLVMVILMLCTGACGAVSDAEPRTETPEPDPELAVTFFNRGVEHFFAGEYDEAIADLDRAIELNLGYIEAYAIRGNAYDNAGRFKDALSNYNQALALDPEEWQVALLLVDRGQAYARHGDTEEAIADLERALELGLQPVVAQEAEAILDYLTR
jgi:tetratricopeptide (TPR) repeat protein